MARSKIPLGERPCPIIWQTSPSSKSWLLYACYFRNSYTLTSKVTSIPFYKVTNNTTTAQFKQPFREPYKLKRNLRTRSTFQKAIAEVCFVVSSISSDTFQENMLPQLHLVKLQWFLARFGRDKIKWYSILLIWKHIHIKAWFAEEATYSHKITRIHDSTMQNL